MISTWYFCCCTGMQPVATQAFMTALEALEDPRSDADLVRLSIEEILKGEQIARQFAVPALIASSLMETRSEPELVAAHQEALDDALAVLDGTLARHLTASWTVLREQGGARGADRLVARLREALARCTSLRSGTIEIEPAPYLHTGEFLAESAILALVVQGARIHTDTVSRFAGDHALVILIRDALDNLYGRLAMLLAVEAATLLGEEVVSTDYIKRHLLEAPKTAGLWEPDVLVSLARLSFANPGGQSLAGSPQRALERILVESITFADLSTLLAKGKPQTAPDAVGRLGLVGQPDELTALVLWQAVLYELAAEIDPVGAANKLRQHWVPPHRPITAPIKLTVPVVPGALATWQRRAALLAGLRARPTQPIRFEPRPGPFRDAGRVAVAILSPWMTRESQAEMDQSPFDRITDGLVLLRLLLATTTAGSLLRRQSGPGRDELIALTLHAGDVLADRVHAGHLDALWFDREGAASESMTPSLSGLALYVRRLIRRLGSGAHAEVDPVWYADYLAREADSTTPEQERRLLNGPAHEVATAWIQDALSGSLPDALELQGRWRSGPEGGRGPAQVTFQHMVERSTPGRVHRPAALAAVHFGEYHQKAQKLAWYTNPERFTPNIWRALAAERQSTERWFALPIKAEPGTDGYLATLSARLRAVMEEGRAADPAFAPWITEWREAIRAVDEPVEFARALRVFLLDLLTLQLSGTTPERQVLEDLIDAEIEFGFGTPLDRWLLFTRLGANPALSEELAHPLRMRMLSGVYRRAGVPARRSRMTDPWSSRESLRSDELLARLLERFVFELNGRRARVQRETVEEVVPRMWRDAHRLPVLREISIDLDPAQTRPARPVPDRRLLMGVTIDSTTDIARLHLGRRPRLTGEVDAFGMSAEEATKAVGAGGEVLGVVAATDGKFTWVNIGTGAPVAANAVKGVSLGDLIIIDVGVGANGDLQCLKGGRLRQPKTEPEMGDLRPTRVTVRRRAGIPEITVAPEGELPTVLGSGSHSEAFRRAWAPDLTGLMTRPDNGPGDAEVYDAPLGARWNGEEWLPADQGLAEFLALVDLTVDERDGAQPLRLVVVDVPDAQSVRFSVVPGSNVVIPHRAWEPLSRDLLLSELTSVGRETTGTVIRAAVRPDDRGRPSLVIENREAGAGEAFDRRAAQWRAQFQEGEFEARWSPERRRYEHDPGPELAEFPVVHVAVNATGQWIRFVAGRWDASDQWRARVEGEVANERNLTLPRRDRKTFDAITYLRPGDTFTLKATVRRAPMFGFVRGWTTTGLEVQVEPESLTFAPIDESTPGKLRVNRIVEVTDKPRLLAPKKPQPPRAIPDDFLLDSIAPAERDAFEDHLIRSRDISGIVVGAPDNNREDPDDLLRVWLDLGETIAECRLRRGDLDNAAVRVGAVVTGERTEAGGWEFHARTRVIQVRARWNLHESTPPDDVDALFLGVITWRGERRAVSQLAAHPDIYIYPMTDDEPGHLARRLRRQQSAGRRSSRPHSQGGWRGAGVDWGRVRVDVTRGRSNGLTRVVASAGGRDEQLFTGVVERPITPLEVGVSGVDVEVYLVAGGYAVVERIFRLTRTRALAMGSDTEDEPDGFRAYLAGARLPLPADLRGHLVTLRVPWQLPVNGSLSSTLPLADGEEPWVEESYTSEDIRVVLEETKGGWVASYRRAPTQDLGEAVPALQRQGLVVGMMSRLRQPLRYVERREVAGEVVHRFEWGYGWTLAVPEALLRVAGREANSWPITPFHGDTITEVCVRQLSDGRWTMDIHRVGFAFGWRNELYHDSLMGLVTTAEIDAANGGSARIQALQVRWRRDPGTDDGRYRDDLRRSVKHAELHPDAARALGEVLTGHTGDETPRALLRLRLEDFRRSGGNVLRFDYVRPILGTDDGLKRGDYVFLEADEIEQLPNDVRLRLKPGRLLGEGQDGFTVLVRRREFSARQELLRQIHQGRQLVAGDVYLVKLGDFDHQREFADGQIRNGLTRPVSTLRSYIGLGHSVQGVVERRTNSGYALELRPNVLFMLAADEVDLPAQLARGTFVRVGMTAAGRISLTPTLRGDHAYLAAAWRRPAVLLPMQNLLRRRDSLREALARGNYSLAGLPAVTAPAIGAQPSHAETEFAEGLLTRDHPKVAMVRCHEGGRVEELVPLDGSVHAGVLLVGTDGTLQAREPGGAGTVRVPWSQVSFLDAGRNDLRARCVGSWWQYHDDSTGRRDGRAPHQPMQPKPLPERATATGEPVFFSTDWSLRHAEELRRFGYPATDLIEGSHGRGGSQSLTLPVAGVAVSPQGKTDGLWVELAPGRVLEVLGAMMTTADGAPMWLDHVAWDHFAPGDRVDLRVDRGHRFDIGAVALRRWEPGSRGGWGNRVLLPVLSVDIDTGALTLGGGRSTVTWPMEPDGPAFTVGDLVWLDDHNRVEPLHGDPDPVADDTVLVHLVDGQLQMVGCGRFECRIDGSDSSWTTAALAAGTYELVDLTGGCLLMTVEKVDGQTLFLSRRLQRDGHLQVEQVIPGRALGRLGDVVVFASGSRLHRCPVADVVPGIPEAVLPVALDRLASFPVPQWLRGCSGQAVAVGLPVQAANAPATKELRATVVCVLGEGADLGVLLWDGGARRPRWLPAAEAGWLTPTHDELTAAFETRADGGLDRRRVIRVVERQDGSVSITRTASNQQLLRQLKVGDAVRVHRLSTPGRDVGGDRYEYAARVYLSDALVRFQTRASTPAPSPAVPRWCEVEEKRRDRGRILVRLCEAGIRQVAMAVPPLVDVHRVEDLAMADHHLFVWEGQSTLVAAADAVAADASSVQLALRPLLDWLTERGQGLFRPESHETLDLVPALSACVLLAKLGEGGDEVAASAAVHVARQIGLRATASQHLEPLIRLWSNAENRGLDPQMWRRLGKIQFGTHIPAAAVEHIRTLDDALRHRSLRRNTEVLLASACVAATVGAHAGYDEIVSGSSVLGMLAGLGRALVPRSATTLAQSSLLPAQVGILEDLRRKAQVGPQLMLLPVPTFLQDPEFLRAGELLGQLIEGQGWASLPPTTSAADPLSTRPNPD